MNTIETILSRLREIPLVTKAETAPIPSEIADLLPSDALTFRALMENNEPIGKAEVYVTKEVYDNPESVDSIVTNVEELFKRMSNGEQPRPVIEVSNETE